LSWVLCLLNDSNFVSKVYHLLEVLIKHFLRKANVKFFGSTHPVQIQQPLTDYCVAVKDLVEFSEFEKENLLKVMLLQLPELIHAWREVFPAILRNV
jgi:hypothetical protein